MAKIRDFTVTEFTSTASTWQPDEMPEHQSGDLLIALLAKDSTTGFSTSSGWTSYIAQDVSGGHIACQAKRATSSSESFSVTLTTETGVLVILAIQDCYGTTLADAWDRTPVVDSADRTTNPYPGISGQSNSYNNSLVIRAMGGGNGNSPTAYPHNVNLYCGDAGQGELGVAYTVQALSGTIPQANWYARLNSQPLREILMSVRAGSGGLKPPYSDPAISSASFIRALGWASSNIPFADTWPTTITLLAIGQAWEQVWVYTGSYTDETTDMNDVGTADVSLGTAVDNALYLGHSEKYDRIGLYVSTAGVGGTIAWEYWNGSAWTGTGNSENLTTAGARHLLLSSTVKNNWQQTSVNGVTKYWIRGRNTVAYSTGVVISQGCRDGFGTIYDAGAAAADSGTNPYADAMSFTPGSSRTQIGATQLNFASAQDMDTGIIIGCVRPSVHRDGAIDPMKLTKFGGGLNITFMDASDNYASFIVFGRDALDADMSGFSTYAIDWNGAASAWASAGSINKSAVTKVIFGGICYYGAITCQWSMLCLVSKLCLAGGSSSNLLGFDDMNLVFNNCVGILPVFKKIGSAATIYAPLQIGGGDPVFISVDLKTFAFPKRYSLTDKYCLWNAADDVAGIKFYPKSGDTIKFTNCLFTSESSYRWEFDSASSSGATVDFGGSTVVGAKVGLANEITLNNVTFSKCKEISAAGTLTNCTFKDSVGSYALTVTTSGDMANISDCTFSNNPYGIRLSSATAQTYDFDNIQFSNNTTKDVYVSATTGTVTINILNGGDTPTYDSAGATVVINNMVTLKITVKDKDDNLIDNAQCAIYKTSDDSELMNEDTVSGIAQQDFNYPGSDVAIYWRVRKSSEGATRYIPVGGVGTITSTGFDVTVTLYTEPLA